MAGRIATGAALAWLLLVLAAGAVVGVASGRLPWPDAWNPWSALRVEATPNLWTRMKLQRLSDAPALCLAALDAAGLAFTPLPDAEAGPDCPLRNTVRLARTRVSSLGGSLVMSCPAAVSLALWERHVVQPAALRHFGVPLARIDQVGTLACRNVYGQAEGRRSRHATADAIDITGFRFADGRRVRVVSDWKAPATSSAAMQASGDGAATDSAAPGASFLAEVQRGACGFFDGVLGPGYNAAHRDHFHLDRGPYRVCR